MHVALPDREVRYHVESSADAVSTQRLLDLVTGDFLPVSQKELNCVFMECNLIRRRAWHGMQADYFFVALVHCTAYISCWE
ncbi:hypothetical protein MUK42_06019 [Musa troglodytarum]|uniref:Uncharacterized protein n=1 Tax=Musa troglodytarum TaxID=320322 RepID=A0A9E7G793_9LILI|nr:hypothetical protein MUK42_06019 [Musa troglodytarum]